jgi:class 3 adenylate cyclase/tetratricopeptide (TPR) repeat protein
MSSGQTMTYNLVPHFIIENYAKNEYNGRFYAGALFVDISGFSALTDQLMKHGQHGAEVLAGVMGKIFEPLIDAVYSQGGFVTGFAGDAFTAVFPDTVSSNASRALAAAITIQEQMQTQAEHGTSYGRYTMSAKVGVAVGEVIWGIVTAEDGQQASYYFQGTAIDGCAEAEHNARPGEVILDAASYEAVRHGVTVEAAGSHFRLTAVTVPLPAPGVDRRPSVNAEQLVHFVPQAAIRAGRSGEFRQVVNMFISLPTVRTEAQLDIFMQTVFNLQAQYGGLLKQLDYGDKGAKLLLFWGAPVAHENDIQRALHFILELQTQTAIPINGGITYHVAHAGYIGSSQRGEYTCYGRGVNLAARFMSGAPRGEIWVDEHIARLAGGQFDLEFDGEKSFKGFTEAQKVYILFERTDGADAFYEGRLVGREDDLDRLAEFIAPIYNGRSPGLFVIWGEPGAGKSRLANEFLAQHLPPGEETQVFLAQTDEILRQSLNPFRYWLKRYFGQSEGLAESRNKRSFNRKLDHLIAETQAQPLADELDRVRSFLGALVGLYWPDSLYEQVDAKGRQEHTLSALSALLQAESRRQPAVLLLEDTHWIDPDSASFLSALLADLAQLKGEQYPLAILATARYEGDNPWLEGVAHQEMNLSALNPSNLSAFTQAYLDAPPAKNLLTLLVERSEGNPFFAEQILRYLRESEQLEKVNGRWQLITREKSPLPGNVNALLVARLDRLAHAVREVVQTAAVLGREFEIRVLSQMLQDAPTLPGKIATAEQESIWSTINEIRYIFKHALLRDAAYRMQLRARRQALHQMALEAIESLFEDDPSGRFGELAYHALAAGLLEPAFKYSLLAGNQAMETYAAAEAVNHYRPAMDLLGQVETNWEQRRQLCALYGRALELTGDPAAALAHYETMGHLARELGDQPLELEALVAQGTLRSTGSVTGNFELAELLGQEGLNLASTLNDRAAEAKILWNLSNVYRLTGRYEKASASGSRAFKLAEAFNLREQMAYIANDLSRVYTGLGQMSEMLANCERVVELWRELKNRPMLIDGLANYGMTLAITGHFDEALATAEEGIALSQASNNLWGEAFMRYTPALVHLQRLEIEAGLSHSSTSLRLAEEGGVTIVQFYVGLFQFLLYLAAKDYKRAMYSAEQSYSIAGQQLSFQKPAAAGAMAIVHIELGDLHTAGELINSYQINLDKLGMLLLLIPELAKCRYLLARSSYDDLLTITKKVTEFAEEQGSSLLIPQFYLIQGQAYLALGNHEAAGKSVQAGLALLRKTGGRWGHSELAKLMSELEEKAG